MAASEVLLHQILNVSDRLRVELRVYKVDQKAKYPEGVKPRFVLIDVELGKPLLLVDNHAPLGFHIHDGLPEDKSQRVKLETDDFNEALEIFW